jgi:outer membrane protein assembly factor BamB
VLALALAIGAAALVVTTVPDHFARFNGRRQSDPVLERRWVVPVRGAPSALAADGDGAVVVTASGDVAALATDGTTRWHLTVSGASRVQPPALDADHVVIGAGNRVVALDRATGVVRWESGVAGGGVGTVVLVDRVVLYGSEAGPGELGALDAATGRPRWSVRHPGAVRSAPVAGAGGVVAAAWHGGDEPRLRAFDLTTGRLRWDAPLERYTSAPVTAGGRIVVAQGDGRRRARVVARRSRNGAVAWATEMPASFESGITPAATSAEVAVVDHFGTLSVLDARTGALRHRVELATPVLRTTVVITGDAAVLTTYDGQLAVVDRRTGRVRHRSNPGGYPIAVAGAGPDLLVALRLPGPGQVESLRLH